MSELTGKLKITKMNKIKKRVVQQPKEKGVVETQPSEQMVDLFDGIAHVLNETEKFKPKKFYKLYVLLNEKEKKSFIGTKRKINIEIKKYLTNRKIVKDYQDIFRNNFEFCDDWGNYSTEYDPNFKPDNSKFITKLEDEIRNNSEWIEIGYGCYMSLLKYVKMGLEIKKIGGSDDLFIIERFYPDDNLTF